MAFVKYHMDNLNKPVKKRKHKKRDGLERAQRKIRKGEKLDMKDIMAAEKAVRMRKRNRFEAMMARLEAMEDDGSPVTPSAGSHIHRGRGRPSKGSLGSAGPKPKTKSPDRGCPASKPVRVSYCKASKKPGRQPDTGCTAAKPMRVSFCRAAKNIKKQKK